MKFHITAASDVGCIRQNNEDMVLVGDRFIRNGHCDVEINMDDTDRYLLALADGMGGHNGGEVASTDVLVNLHYFFYDLPSGLNVSDFNEAIFEWLDSINNIIDSKGHSNPEFRDMGTTLVSLVCYGGEFYWMNCGDSRIYRLHDRKLVQLSIDHSLNNLMGSSEHSNIITNCIGGGCKTSYIDTLKCTADVLPGDTFMLCSDGLSDMLADTDIEAILNDGGDAPLLCQKAIEAGGYDNVSVCVVRIGS